MAEMAGFGCFGQTRASLPILISANKKMDVLQV